MTRATTCSGVSAKLVAVVVGDARREQQRRDVVAGCRRLLGDDLRHDPDDLPGSRPGTRRACCRVRRRRPGRASGPTAGAGRPGLHRYPQHLRDHHHGQVGRVLGDDVELAPVACAVEDLGGDGADRRFEVVDGPGVNTRDTSLRCHWWSGSSVAISRSVDLGGELLDARSVPGHERRRVQVGLEDVVEA